MTMIQRFVKSNKEIDIKISELEFAKKWLERLPSDDPRVYDDYKNAILRNEIEELSLRISVLKIAKDKTECLLNVIKWLEE